MTDLLSDGYERFRRAGWPERREIYERLARDGQAPTVMIVACSDSRVDPTVIFDAAPGELFTVRNIAALVPAYPPDAACHGTSAALEYAVRSLKVSEIVVLGHAMCGGVRFLLEGGAGRGDTDFVGQWMRAAEPVRALTCDAPDPQSVGESEVVRLSLRNLLTFPWIASRVQDGTLTLRGGIFDIRDGALNWL